MDNLGEQKKKSNNNNILRNLFPVIRHMNKRLAQNRERGMTLLEVVTALAIFIILMTSVAMLYEPSMRIYEESTNLARSNLIFDNIMDRVGDEIAYAAQIIVKEEWAPATAQVGGIREMEYESPIYGTMKITQDDGGNLQITQVLRPDETASPGTVLFTKDFYMGNQIQLGIVPQYPPGENKTDVVNIQLALYDKYGKLMGTREKFITLLNTKISK